MKLCLATGMSPFSRSLRQLVIFAFKQILLIKIRLENYKLEFLITFVSPEKPRTMNCSASLRAASQWWKRKILLEVDQQESTLMRKHYEAADSSPTTLDSSA